MSTATQTRYPLDMNQAARGQAEVFPAKVAQDAIEFVETYAREKPVSMALWALGIGFVLGWKMKPW